MEKSERWQQDLATGWQALERGDLRAAEEAAQAAAQGDALGVEVARLLGTIFYLQGRFAEAVAPLREMYRRTGERNAGYQLGHSHLAAGDPKNAAIILEQVTGTAPDFVEALNLLGIALVQQSRYEEAAKVFASVIERNPRLAGGYNNLGNALMELGRHEEALPHFEKAIELEPEFSPALNNLGLVHKALKRFGVALEYAQRAQRVAPEDSQVCGNLASILAGLARREEAVAWYRKALDLNPDHPQTYVDLGVTLDDLGHRNEAIECFRKALAIDPESSEALTGLGVAYQQVKRFDDAIACHLRAIALAPNYVIAYDNLGIAYREVNRLEEAVACHQKAVLLDPRFAGAHANMGRALYYLKRASEAIGCFERSILLDPSNAEVFNDFGVTCQGELRFEQAVDSYHKAIELKPELVSAHHNLGTALQDLGRYGEAIACFEKTLATEPDRDYTLSALAWSQLMGCQWEGLELRARALGECVRKGGIVVDPFAFISMSPDPGGQQLCAKIYSTRRIPAGVSPLSPESLFRHQKIRLAYLSADFRAHAVGHCVAELFELHDRSRFEVIAVSFGPDDKSELRKRLAQGVDKFADLQRSDDLEIAKSMRELEVDIAIDLMGPTGYARPGILAYRPAPIQVNYLGYPGTMGSEFIDYILADRFVLPPEQQRFYTEKVVYLPDSYQVNDSKRLIEERTPTRAEVGLPPEGFVFCCFNNSYKIQPPVFDAWMRLLGQVSGSVLWLLRDNALAEENLRREARLRGVDPARLVFTPRVEAANYRARSRLADLYLDTLPYTGHGTTSDMLWSGLPVLTCAGSTFAGRVAGSLLHAVGLPELVTASLEEYEALGLRLATDPALLGDLRQRLARNRMTAPLFDTDRFRRHIESAYATMLEIQQRGEKPRAFAVDPIR